MSLGFTPGDENRGEVVFDCAVNAPANEGFRACVRTRIYEVSPAGTAEPSPSPEFFRSLFNRAVNSPRFDGFNVFQCGAADAIGLVRALARWERGS
jgi:hypothetical protein